MFRCWDCVDPSNRFPDLPRCCAYRHRYRSRNVTTIKIMSPLTINRRTAIDNHRMSVKSTFGYRGRQRGKWTNGGDDAQKFRLPVPVAVPTLLSILHPEPRGSIGSYQLPIITRSIEWRDLLLLLAATRYVAAITVDRSWMAGPRSKVFGNCRHGLIGASW